MALDRRSLLNLLALGSVGFVTSSAIGQDSPNTDESSSDTGTPITGNILLQSVGALGVGHIQSSLGLIGVLADSISRDLYSAKQIEDLMKGTINSLDIPKRMLRRLQDTRISTEDAEFIDRMIGVMNSLQLEARALANYSASRKPDDAAKYEAERRRVLKKLAELTQQDDFNRPVSTPTPAPAPRSVPTPKSSTPRTSRVDGPRN